MATVRWLMLMSLSCLAAPAETALAGHSVVLTQTPSPWGEGWGEGSYGSPKSAVVMVDGREMGVVPGKFKVDSGGHDVVVRLQGYHDAEYKVNVPSDKKHVTEVQIDLAVDASQKALVRQPKDKPEVVQVGGHSESYTKPHWSNWLVAGGLVAFAIPLAVSGFWTLADNGACIGELDANNLCSEQVQFGAAAGLMLAGAGVLVAGGVAVALWQPIPVSVSASKERAQVTVSGRF